VVGLAGKTDLEQSRADMLIYCIDDTFSPLLKFLFESDEAKKVRTHKNTHSGVTRGAKGEGGAGAEAGRGNGPPWVTPSRGVTLMKVYVLPLNLQRTLDKQSLRRRRVREDDSKGHHFFTFFVEK